MEAYTSFPASSPKGTGLRPPPLGSDSRDEGVTPHILNYYNYNVDTIWIMGMVVFGMIISIVFLKIMLWNAIYRHFGEYYPMGKMFGSSAVAHIRNTVHHEETFVGTSASASANYPSLNHLTFRPMCDIIRHLYMGMITIQKRVVEYWKHADRTILDIHDTVGHMRNTVYNEYIRSYL